MCDRDMRSLVKFLDYQRSVIVLNLLHSLITLSAKREKITKMVFWDFSGCECFLYETEVFRDARHARPEHTVHSDPVDSNYREFSREREK